MNNVILIGRITKEIELKSSSSGVKYCQFSIAVNEYVNGEQQTDFLNIACFGSMAENLGKYGYKGMKIALQGKLKTKSYINKNGQKISNVDVIANFITYLSKNKDDTNQPFEF